MIREGTESDLDSIVEMAGEFWKQTIYDEPLCKELVFEIHRLVTNETLDDPSAAGRFRSSSPRDTDNCRPRCRYRL